MSHIKKIIGVTLRRFEVKKHIFAVAIKILINF